MAAPTIQSVYPTDQSTGAPLGAAVRVTFDQVIDTESLDEGTFVLSGPGQTSILTPDQLIQEDPSIISGREFVEGVFSFDNSAGHTVATFTPRFPLRKNVTYTVTVVGADSVLASKYVQNAALEAMAQSYEWSFTTGALTQAPPQMPLPATGYARINPEDILVVSLQPSVPVDLSHGLKLIFPEDIDPNSIDLGQIKVSVDAMLNDPDVVVPSGLEAEVAINGREITINITGWPPA